MRFEDSVVTDGEMFYRRRTDQYGDVPTAMRFQADRPLTDDEMQRFAQAVGYSWASKIRTRQALGDPVRDGDDAFTVTCDLSQCPRASRALALTEFEIDLSDTVQEGSPVRTTNRAGVGTKGTRLVEGLGYLRFALYYNSVQQGASSFGKTSG